MGRHFDGVLSYPSGNVTNVAAVATALALATSGRIRVVVGVLGAVATGAMAVAVTGLRWHFPTDALGGAVFGVGVVLLVDGVLHLHELRTVAGPGAPGPPARRHRSGTRGAAEAGRGGGPSSKMMMLALAQPGPEAVDYGGAGVSPRGQALCR